ncbi:MAG: hypothetical protein WC384_23030 [Prolixibacteraceae bacterium]
MTSNVTLRLIARPSGVSFVATGFVPSDGFSFETNLFEGDTNTD